MPERSRSGADSPSLRGTNRPSAARRGTAAAVVVTSACVLPMFLAGAVAPQLHRDLGLSAAHLGIAVAAFSAGGVISSGPLGRVADRVGPARTLRFGALATAAAMTMIAVAVQTTSQLIAGMFTAGVAYGCVPPAANAFLLDVVAGGRLGFALGIKQAAIPVATLMTGVIVPTVSVTYGWRWAFAAGALAAVLAGQTVPRGSTRVARLTTGRWTPSTGLVILGLGVGAGAAASSPLGIYVVGAASSTGHSARLTGWIVVIASIVGVTTRVLSGHRADAGAGREGLVAARMLAIGAVVHLALASESPLIVPVAIVLAYGTAWGWPTLLHLAVLKRNSTSPGAATGVTQTGALSGALTGPLLFGFALEVGSYRVAWTGCAVASLAGAGLVLLGIRRLDRERLVSPDLP